jgi:uncharacterized membrane protein YheB (UPF0754 family)
MNYWHLLIPLLSALSGWLIVKLLIRSLFRPLPFSTLAGAQSKGILGKHQQELAARIGKMASSMLNPANLEEMISDPSHVEKLKPMIEDHVDGFLRVKLKEQMPMISMFVGDKTIQTLKTVFMQEIETLFPQVMRKFAGNLEKEFDIEQMVVTKINSLSVSSMESAFYDDFGREIRAAALLGALIGLLAGLLQLTILILAG